MQLSSITLLIGLSLFITAIIPELIKDDKKLQRIILMGVFSIVTFCLTEWRQNLNDVSQKKEKAQSDSLYQVRTDSAVGNVVTAFGKAVGEYNLRIDSGFNGVIKIMKDSSKRKINQVAEKDPHFGPCLPDSTAIAFDRIEKGWILAKLSFCSEIATATNVDLNVAFVIENKDGLQFLSDNKSAFHNSNIPKEIGTIRRYPINISNTISNNIYIYMYGQYKGSSPGKYLYVNNFYAMEYNTGKFIISYPGEFEKIYSFLSGNGDIQAFLKRNNLEIGSF
jgi:hypothetical protein